MIIWWTLGKLYRKYHLLKPLAIETHHTNKKKKKTEEEVMVSSICKGILPWYMVNSIAYTHLNWIKIY